MPLNAGDKLGPYEILSPLGAGGMGEVYKARDTRLDRSVAIKVLPEHIAMREDLRARFEREARAVASLNHPNICVLHDIGTQDGGGYMVMEHMEGETLAARIERGALPLDQALKLATQIADALDRAHRAGVTHRDVKPQNIMLTRDGAKVLDFGLAKSTSRPGPSDETLVKVLTSEGTVLGTPQYMAPEQFEGREADARSDIWAFGAVLYEIVTGRKAFQGKNYTSLVGAILAAEPAPMAVTPFTPAWLQRLVMRCLAKDPEDRWQSMRDVVLELRTPPQAAETVPADASRWPWAVAAVGVLLAAVLGGVMLTRQRTVVDAAPMEFEMKVPGGAGLVLVSPNGKWIAWRENGTRRFWVRSIDSIKALPTEVVNPSSMSWSPDSRFIAFRSSGVLKKIEIPNMTVQVVAPETDTTVGTINGTAWTADGQIVLGAGSGPLQRISAAGGQPTAVLELDKKAGELAQRQPLVLPDGKHVLYFSIRSGPAAVGIYLAGLDGKQPPKRVYNRVPFKFVPPNTLLVNDNARLMAMTLNLESGETGEPAVLSATEANSFSASSDGRVLGLIGGATFNEELNIYDRTGKKLETLTNAAPYPSAHVEFSPDGRRLLLERETGANVDLWTVELGRKVVSRLTFGEGNESPGIWSANGQSVYFFANRNKAGMGIYEIPANGTGSEKLIHSTSTHHMHASPDGKYLLFERTAAGLGLDYIDLQNRNKPGVYLTQAASSPQFSPDSKLVTYESAETGRSEVYVQTFPAGGGKWQISTNGGLEPRWRGDGKELYYDRGDGTVMAASIAVRGGSLEVTTTKELFRFHRGGTAGTAIAVTQDGQLFAIRESPVGSESSILLKLNWKLPGR
ncbi:MAG TPA: protein kinase [Paludibaculum sp.]